ncbi:hypothetical protein HAX54_048964, partial [Datura stramonium]|nr:hypothetical protein [Datura stramonium]
KSSYFQGSTVAVGLVSSWRDHGSGQATSAVIANPVKSNPKSSSRPYLQRSSILKE